MAENARMSFFPLDWDAKMRINFRRSAKIISILFRDETVILEYFLSSWVIIEREMSENSMRIQWEVKNHKKSCMVLPGKLAIFIENPTELNENRARIEWESNEKWSKIRNLQWSSLGNWAFSQESSRIERESSENAMRSERKDINN